VEQAEIGLIGLGVMGSNLALNIAEKGNRIAVFNRSPEATRKFFAEAGDLQGQIVPCETLEEFVAAIRPPRPIIIMIKAGEPVDQQMAALTPYLSAGDIMIDAGNANFRDTMRRFDGLKDSDLTFIGMGVSGGEEGARHGPSIMVGGTEESWKRVEKVLTSISAKFNNDPCVAWLGENGAGHFVKTIHNGIEYADMQMIAEIYGILRDGLGMSAQEIGEVFGRWNTGRLNSYLIEITEKVLKAADPLSGKPRGRGNRRPCRPEGHRQVVGDRGTEHGGCCDRHRGRRRGTYPIFAKERAREGGDHSRPSVAFRGAEGPGCIPCGPGECIACCQDRRVCAGFRGHVRSLRRVRMEPADADDCAYLARRLHHPLTVPR